MFAQSEKLRQQTVEIWANTAKLPEPLAWQIESRCMTCQIHVCLQNKGLTVLSQKAARHTLPSLLSYQCFRLHNMTCSTSSSPSLFFLLWLPMQRQKTDNSGTYGGQEVMQINVSQHRYILALQSPCREEEVRGQLSIIGPQMISEEGLMHERGGLGEEMLKRYQE